MLKGYMVRERLGTPALKYVKAVVRSYYGLSGYLQTDCCASCLIHKPLRRCQLYTDYVNGWFHNNTSNSMFSRKPSILTIIFI